MKVTEIDIPPGGEGEYQINNSGFQGQGCKQVSEMIQKIIGGKVMSDTPTPEAQTPERAPERCR